MVGPWTNWVLWTYSIPPPASKKAGRHWEGSPMARNQREEDTQTKRSAAAQRANLALLVVPVLFAGVFGWALYSRRPASAAIALPKTVSSAEMSAPEPL